MILHLLAAAIAALDPCAPVAPATPADPTLAATYLSVGRDEQTAHRNESAIAAYREVLRYEPGNAHARAALEAFCQAVRTSPPDLFAEGAHRLETGDWSAAAELLSLARARAPDPSAALLEGVARYELGDDEVAIKALREAETDSSLRGSALLFEGLIAYRQDRREQASELFRQAAASADPRLQTSANDLLRLTRRQGRLTFSVEADVGYDTNVSLAPTGDPSAATAKDGFANAATALQFEPWVTHGPFLGVSGLYRKQFTLSQFDLGALSGNAGWEFGGPRRGLVAEYIFDALAYGGAAYMNAHRALLHARTTFEALGLGLLYSARRENYLASGLTDFSGWRQFGEAEAWWSFAGGSSIELDYQFTYDAAQVTALTYREHGPHLSFYWRALPRLKLGVEGNLWLRNYLAADEGEPAIRHDFVLEGVAVGEVSLTDHWALRLLLDARRAASTEAFFTYNKAVASLGLSYVTGLF